ncbi:hypothetical protein GQ44DRAFT_735100 [Phaeosphaeriaceae sp. PMI808]|nr:hypothetical protein GQ44DRAFT_735100 [Phaeosphaeriaceae sp. PMI808]
MTFGSGDNYRPGDQNQSHFTFESQHAAPQFPPSAPANSGSRAPARGGRSGAHNRRNGDHYGASRNGRSKARANRRGRPRAPAPHERALLQHRDQGSPERTYGVSLGPNRFKDVDNMSDDEEADMDVETDASAASDDLNVQPSNHKLVRTQVTRADGDSVPRWSNPDPYTSLPPPSETTGVKKDVVQLIRKAKNQAAERTIGNGAVAANDDFISFADDDDGDDNDDESEDGEVVDEPGSHLYEDDKPIVGSMNDYGRIGKPLSQPRRETNYVSESKKGHKRKFSADVAITPDWIASPRANPSPWAREQVAYNHLIGDPEKWLHNEIMDFYEFVAPTKFEHKARRNLVDRISNALRNTKVFPHDAGQILCFGSYPAGLYLPTADMDLVYASDRHYDGGSPVLDAAQDRGIFKKTLFKASNRLKNVGIAENSFVIAKARVPIIKFQDRVTGLDVDISFENLSGVQAQATFDKWKSEYPDMIFLVVLVKQLLSMRGLNEVHHGGLGGFSIICLVVSYIQHNRKTDNLGACFLGFLEYYGKKFDLAKQRIQMHPPAIVKKTHMGIDGRVEQPTGLSIQDPNKPDNNISGGSHKAANAFGVFAAAHDTLTDRMKASAAGHDIGPSILECVIGGNYDSYIRQRRRMESLR